MTALTRDAIFISHANPEDNDFTVWLGARLTAAGYEVWADVLCAQTAGRSGLATSAVGRTAESVNDFETPGSQSSEHSAASSPRSVG